MADVNAWSIIVPGVVTPCVVAGFAWWQQHVARRAEEQREIREVLDIASDTLTTMLRALVPIENTWRSRGTLRGEDVVAATDAMFGLARALSRLKLRLGDEMPVSNAFDVVVDRCEDYYDLVRDGHLESNAYDAEAVREAEDAAFDAASRFIREAHQLVGLREHRVPSPLWRTLPLPPGHES